MKIIAIIYLSNSQILKIKNKIFEFLIDKLSKITIN